MFKDLVQKNRSYRRFDESVSISEEQLISLVDLARHCPSARNAQPLRYITISSREECNKLFPHLKWAGYLKDWDGPLEGERPSAYIVILNDTTISNNPSIDLGICAQTILLGATELGFGGCMFGAIDRPAITELLKIDEKYTIPLVIALGKPVEKVVLTEIGSDGDIKYYRDKNGVHYVPKRKLTETLLESRK